MRIISGSARGRRLFAPGNSKTNRHIRPTSDRAREALFNIIGQDKLQQKSVLDLFAGTGALGLEALSRGAAFSLFVDNHSPAIKIIHQNISLCGFSSVSAVIQRDLSKGLFFLEQSMSMLRKNSLTSSFDLVFLDPPYDQGKCDYYLLELQKHGLINKNSHIIYEDRSGQQLPSYIEKCVLYDQRKYGDTGFWFYNQKENLSCKS